jgi:hypothetical protein
MRDEQNNRRNNYRITQFRDTTEIFKSYIYIILQLNYFLEKKI